MAASDDVESPHDRTLDVPEPASVADLLASVARGYPLPLVERGKATWVLASGVPLAVFAQQWSVPRSVLHLPLRLEDLDYDGRTLRLHFSYLVQLPPDVVYDVVGRLRLRAL